MNKSNRLYAPSRKCKVTRMPFAGRPPRPVRLYGEKSRPSSGYKGGHKQGIILGGTDNQSFAFHPDPQERDMQESCHCRERRLYAQSKPLDGDAIPTYYSRRCAAPSPSQGKGKEIASDQNCRACIHPSILSQRGARIAQTRSFSREQLTQVRHLQKAM